MPESFFGSRMGEITNNRHLQTKAEDTGFRSGEQ